MLFVSDTQVVVLIHFINLIYLLNLNSSEKWTAAVWEG